MNIKCRLLNGGHFLSATIYKTRPSLNSVQPTECLCNAGNILKQEVKFQSAVFNTKHT